MAWMLLNVAPRGFEDLEITEVKFQRRYIDDLPMDDIIVSIAISHAPRGIGRLSLQLKHDLAWGDGESNQIFHAVIRACWDTFRSTDFVRGYDYYGVVLGREKSDYPTYREVIGFALACTDGRDFLKLIASVTSSKHNNFVNLIRTKLNLFLLEDGYKNQISDDELWQFFKGLKLLQFDVLEEGSRDYQNCLAQIKIFGRVSKVMLNS